MNLKIKILGVFTPSILVFPLAAGLQLRQIFHPHDLSDVLLILEVQPEFLLFNLVQHCLNVFYLL